MNATILKLIAILAMTCDHYAYTFIDADSTEYYLLRLFGRLTAPIMAFMLTEGYKHTRSRKKYIARLSALAIISQPIYYYFTFGIPTDTISFLTNWSIIFSFVVSLLILCIRDSRNIKMTFKWIMIAVLISLSKFGDYGYLVPMWVLIYSSRFSKKKKTVLLGTVSGILLFLQYANCYDSFWHFSFMFGAVFALIPIHFYNGQRGKIKIKHLFYWYYPAHLILLSVIKIIFILK